MLTRNKVTGLILGGVAALGISVGATTVFAQSAESTSAPTLQLAADEDTLNADELAPGGPGFGMRGFGGGGMMGGEILANALGITPAELRTAMQQIPDLAIAKAVESGDITQEQADQMTAQGRSQRGFLGIRANLVQDELLAEALGITPEELATAQDNAIPMAVEAGLLTQAQADDLLVQKMIRNAVESAREEALQQAVADGLLTQAQADRMLEQGGFGGGRGFGHERGMQGMPGGRGNFGPSMRNGQGGQPGFGPGNQQQQPQEDGQSSLPVVPDSTVTQGSEL